MDGLPPNLDALMSPPAIESAATAESDARARLMSEAACSIGARGGLSARADAIRRSLDARASELDRAYPFQTVMLSGMVMPPVISEALRSVRQDDGQTVRFAGAIYRIIAPEHLVTVAPTWRDYLYEGLTVEGKIELPHASLLPKSSDDKAVWQQSVKACWAKGVDQANSIFSLNLAHLTQDFSGMLRYKLLSVKGMVSDPRYSVERHPTAGNGRELIVDDQTYRITAGSRFQLEDRKWK